MAPTSDERDLYIAVWAKAVDTQMHFNEMSVRARQFGLGFVAAALGLGVVLLSRGQEATLDIPFFGGFKLHATVVIALASAVSVYAVKLLDLGVYHRMLRGAVYFGEDFERNYMKEIFSLNKGMTETISHFSRHDDAKASLADDGKYQYSGTSVRSAEQKIKRFYRFSIWSLIALAVFLFITTSGINLFAPMKKSDSIPQLSQRAPASNIGTTATIGKSK